MGNSKLFEYKGVLYKTQKDFMREHGLSPNAFYNRLKKGIPLDAQVASINKGKSININGVQYNSVAEMAKALGVSRHAIRHRIKKNIPLDIPFKKQSGRIRVSIDGVVFESVKKASLVLGIRHEKILCAIKKLNTTHLTMKDFTNEQKKQVVILDKSFSSISQAVAFLGYKTKGTHLKDLNNFRHIIRHGKKYIISRKNRPTTFEALFRIIDTLDKKEWCYDLLDKNLYSNPFIKNISRSAVERYRHPVLRNIVHKKASNRVSFFCETAPIISYEHHFCIHAFIRDNQDVIKKWHANGVLNWLSYRFLVFFNYKLKPLEKKEIWGATERKVYPLSLLQECLDEMLAMSFSEFNRRAKTLTGRILYGRNEYEILAEGKPRHRLNQL